MTTPTPTRAAALLLVAASACAPRPIDAPVPPPRRVQAAEAYRPLDGLLTTPALQAIVELQVDRDAAGIVPSLVDADARVRARAAFALASVQDTTAVPELIDALDDADPAVRMDVAHALGQTPTPGGAAALLERAASEADTAVLVVVLDALGRAGAATELAGLAELELVDGRGDAPVLAAALALAYARFAMRDLHHDAATDWTADALGADDAIVRSNAAYFFARSASPEAWSDERSRIVDALERYDRADRATMHLLSALGRLEELRDVALVIDWLQASPDWAIRVNAVRALARLVNVVHDDDEGRVAAGAAARAALIGALDDASHHVRRAAAEALAAAPPGTLAIADTLVARLESHAAEPPVYGALMRAIARAGRPDVALERWLASADTTMRAAGVGAVAYAPGVAAFEHIAAAATAPDARLASAAVAALVERRALDLPDAIDDRYFETYATALRTRDQAVSFGAASALADSTFALFGAGPLLQSVLLQMRGAEDAEVMVEIIRALGVLKDETAVPLLRELRAGRAPDLRAAAAAALAEITGEAATVAATEPAPTRLLQWQWLAQWGDAPRLRIETVRGVVVVELSPEQAPLTTQTMLTLATEGRFDDTPFHRVVPNFVIQGGDVSRGDGWGGPGFVIRSELTRIPYLRGSAGMASSGKDTEGSQWFVTHSMQAHLDGRYTAFGTVVEGLDVVDAIREGDRVIRVTAEPTTP